MALALTGCRATESGADLRRYEFLEPHMGTLFKITLFAPDALTATRSAEAAFRRVEQLNRRMTDYDPDSELMRLSQHPPGEPVKVSDDLFNVLAEAQKFARLSDGAFDVTVGPQVQLWRKARKSRTLPSPSEIASQAIAFWDAACFASPATALSTLMKIRPLIC